MYRWPCAVAEKLKTSDIHIIKKHGKNNAFLIYRFERKNTNSVILWILKFNYFCIRSQFFMFGLLMKVFICRVRDIFGEIWTCRGAALFPFISTLNQS